jgi:hypothetical protein
MKLQKIEKRSFAESTVDNAAADSLIDTSQEKTTEAFPDGVRIDSADAVDTVNSDTSETVGENSPVVDPQASDSNSTVIQNSKRVEPESSTEKKVAAPEKEVRKSSAKRNKKEKNKEEGNGSW